MKFLRNILLVLLSTVFLLSGISKLISVDYFEQFIYSFGVLSLTQSIVFTRLLIVFELVLGLFFVLRIYLKWVCYASIAMLVVFTAFIIYLEVSQTSADCYCFGTLVQFSNAVSIIKNIILLLLIFVLQKSSQLTALLSQFHALQFLVVIIVALGVTFGVNFPNGLIQGKVQVDYCKPCFDNFLQKNQLSNQKRLICFFSTRCKYCQLSAKLITTMTRKVGNTESVLYILWDNDHNSDSFFKQTDSFHFETREMDVLKFLDLTKGVMPLIVLYDKGEVVRCYRYADLDEEAVLQFLKTN